MCADDGALTGNIEINLISADGINYSPYTLILSTIRCIQWIDSEWSYSVS